MGLHPETLGKEVVKKGGGREEAGGETPSQTATLVHPARERGVSVRLCRGDGVSAGNGIERVAKFGPAAVGPCKRVCLGDVCSDRSAYLAL